MTELSAVNVKITGDAGDLKTELNTVQSELNQTGKSATAAQGRLKGLATGATRTSRNLAKASRGNSGFARSVQNASFQLGDFAVQVGSGQRASIALAQQLPQLLGGFGVLGAVAGAAVAILVPLATAMRDLASNGEDVTRVFGTLQPVAQSIGVAFGAIGSAALSMAELVVNNIDRILITAGSLAAFMAGKWVVAFAAARIATFSLAGSLAFLRTALIRTGIGALVIGAGELIYQFSRLVKASGSFGTAIGLIWDVGKEAFNRLGLSVALLKTNFQIVINEIQFAWANGLGKMQLAFASFLDGIAGIAPDFMGLEGGNVARVGEAINKELNSIVGAGVTLYDEKGDIQSQLAAPMESIAKIRELLLGMKEDGITLDSILGGGGGEGEDGEGSTLKEKLSEREKAIAEHMDRIRALTEGGLSGKLGAWGKYFSNLTSLTQSNSQKLLGISKSFAAGQALIDAWVAHNKVLADPTLPWYARIASAAQVLGAGLGAVNAIKSVSAGGSGSTAAAGASSATTSTATSSAATSNVSISLPGGDMFSRTQVIQLINSINDAVDDGANLRLV